MQKSVTINFTLDELRQVINECVNSSSNNPTNNGEVDDVMTQRQAAKYLGVSQTTIIKYKKQGKIPYEQLPGSSRVRFYKSQLRKVLAKNKHLLQASRK